MISRRAVVVSLAAVAFTTGGLFGPSPSKVTVNIAGGAGMNPGPDGGDRPVVVIIYRLRSTGAFQQVDYFALDGNASGALGGDLIGFDSVSVRPGKRASQKIVVEPEAIALGFAAFVRDPTGRQWKSMQTISPGSKLTITVALGRGGVSVSGGKKIITSSQDQR